MNHPLQLHPKTAAAGLSGSAALVVIWILGLLHVQVTAEEAGALVVVLAGLGSWLAPLLPHCETDQVTPVNVVVQHGAVVDTTAEVAKPHARKPAAG